MKAPGLLTMIACLAVAASTSAQNQPAPGPFDGKWVGESGRCSPTQNYRFGGITVSNSSFSWSAMDGDGRRRAE